MALAKDNDVPAQIQAPLTELVAAWAFAGENWTKATHDPEAGNFDTPACLFWHHERTRLQGLIEAAKVVTQADAAAMIQFIWLDADADADDWPQVRRAALQAVKEWAQV